MPHSLNPCRVSRGRQSGVALIIALIMLMILTMIAVIAMRTTTLDLKITTNQVIAKPQFQVSETARGRMHEVIDDHTFYRGWPVAIGGAVPATTGFSIPAIIDIDDDDGLQELYRVNNFPHFDMQTDAIDMRMREGDTDGDDNYDSPYDLAADIFISRVTATAAPGSDTSQVTGYEGLGAGVAGAGSHLYFRIISRAGWGTGDDDDSETGVSAARSITDAFYRYVVTN